MKNADWQRDDWRVWRNPQAWPFAPSSYLYLADAAEQLCARAWGKQWMKPFHYDWAQPIPPSADEVFDAEGRIACSDTYVNRSPDVRAVLGRGWEYLPISREAWSLAHERAKSHFIHSDAFMDQREKAVVFLHGLFAEGVVQTAIKEIAKGQFHLVAPHAWYCERPVAEKRIRTCSIDMLNPFGLATSKETAPFPLFVPEESLERALVTVDDVRAGRRPPPDAQEVKGLRQRSSSTGRGRREGTGIDDRAHLAKMLELVQDGRTAWDAAGEVALGSEVKGASVEAKQKRLHSKFAAANPDLS